MMNKKMSQMIHILEESSGEMSASSLATRIGVSERTIRNYVTSINEEGAYFIQASHQGYLLTRMPENHKHEESSEIEERTYHVLSRLLTSSDGVSAFDEANELMVSDSTIINSVLPKIRTLIQDFDLKIQSRNYVYYLIGSERNKRRLIGHLATNNSYGFFTSSDSLEKIFPDIDVKTILQDLYEITQNSNLFLNNYALNNLLIHLLVILLRLKSKDTLSFSDSLDSVNATISEFENKDEIIKATDNIEQYFQDKYQLTIPDADYKQILLLVALSIDHDQTSLDDIIEKEFPDTIIRLLDQLNMRYGTPKFSRDFAMQFCLHMYQARQRYEYHISYPNPIAAQIKKDYAPIYDMAVYFSHQFCKHYSIELSEDEIAFIAFHIGAYLENQKQNSNGLTCILITEQYHDFSTRLATEVRNIFGKEISSMDVYTLNRYTMYKPKCDLLITTIKSITLHPHRIVVSPILTKQNIIDIWSEIQKIHDRQKLERSSVFLKSMLHKELYFRNIPFSDQNDCIRFLGHECIRYGYVREEFIQDVLLRENVSSTAFTECVAIPHSISQYAEKSFICILHNEIPLSWGAKKVNFVLMIGIAKNDMKYFNESFDIIINQFYSTDHASVLLKTRSFDEFCSILLKTQDI